LIRAPRSLALLWFVLPFLAFISTLQGRIQYWDTGEMQTVPWIFGIPHPTGFPAYVLIAGAFAHVFAVGTVAWRTSLFCALLALGCVLLVYAIVVSITGDRWTAICAAWLLAFGWYFWVYGDRAEIHVVAAFCAALVLYFALRGYYDQDVRWFFAACAALGLGLATHPIVLFLMPSLLVLACARLNLFDWRRAAIALLLLVAPLSLYVYLPLRSHAIVAHGMDPNAVLGKPLGAAIANTDNPQTRAGFIRLVTGAEFHATRSIVRIFDISFYAKKLDVFGNAIYSEFSPVGCAAACICFGVLFRRRAVVALALLLAVLLPGAFALAYPPVVEIERYFFIPMIAIAAAVGLGITAFAPYYRHLLRIPLATAAVVLLVINYPDAHLHAVFGAEDLIAEVERVTPQNAIVMADWTRGTALAYARYVDGDLRGRTLDIAWPFQEVRYLRGWLRDRPVYYVGRIVPGPHRLRLCRVSQGYPVYSVQLEPARC
jgi:4-amino-4-deoxy-L-arabinose transferase-like glycosyltransferase